jgi:hypothetical protein
MKPTPRIPTWKWLLLVLGALFVCGVIGNLGKSPQSPGPVKQDQSQVSRRNASTPKPEGIQQVAPAPVAPIAAPTAVPDLAASEAGNLPDTGYVYANPTSHSVIGFAVPYLQLGGVTGLGYPVTEQVIEKSAIDGKSRWTQYFEKGVLEYHPDLPEGNRFLSSSLGAWRLNQKYGGTPPTTLARSVPGTGMYVFPETKHTVRGTFLKRWHEGGEVARYGYPLSESFLEKSDADGKNYIVQYFERAVMEYHPEKQPPYDVQLAALGNLALTAYHPSSSAFEARNPVPSPTPDYAATATAKEQQANATATTVAIVRERSDAATATTVAIDTERSGYATATAVAKANNLANSNTGTGTSTGAGTSTGTAPGQFIPYAGNGGGPTQCNDGTWSHSSGRGTCSHHGGIKR